MHNSVAKLNKLFIICCFLIGLAGCVKAPGQSDALVDEVMDKNTKALELSALENFEYIKQAEYIYKDYQRMALAINAELLKDEFVSVSYINQTLSGICRVELTALTEIDGESEYQLTINNRDLAVRTNPESENDFMPVNHMWANVSLSKGDRIVVSFNAVTNGKIPENDITAYSRGRWTKLVFNCK